MTCVISPQVGNLRSVWRTGLWGLATYQQPDGLEEAVARPGFSRVSTWKRQLNGPCSVTHR